MPAASSMIMRRSAGLALIRVPTRPWLTIAVEREPVAASANSVCTSPARVSPPPPGAAGAVRPIGDRRLPVPAGDAPAVHRIGRAVTALDAAHDVELVGV